MCTIWWTTYLSRPPSPARPRPNIALGGRKKTAPQRAVQAGRGVRYVVPQRIRARASGNLDLYFRVDNVYRGATLEVLCGEDVILRRKRPIVTPGEWKRSPSTLQP